MANQFGGSNTVVREYRKGNWSVSETMVLIEAKRMDDERRMKRSNDPSEARNKPQELRWKWVEDFCWRKGCLRSQNQCNDKWDNLMRDYKKVRDYEKRLNDNNHEVSYWELGKNERKERNLPSNMLVQIYDALVEVVEKKGGTDTLQTAIVIVSEGRINVPEMYPTMSLPQPTPTPLLHQRTSSLTHPILQHHISLPNTTLPLPTLPTPSPPPPPPPPLPQAQPLPPIPIPFPHSQGPLPIDSETSEYSTDSPQKRRRKSSGGGRSSSGGEGASGTAEAIARSGRIIAEAIQASEENIERRHKDLLSFHERRLNIEETKNGVYREGINGLVGAIGKLSNSILALANSHHHQNQPSSSSPK